LSNSSHPILIDQPEDNLDNRTVYNELRDFIRERKERRQIIMVTHNANMVVSTDSECVIVANQAGQQHDMENEQFRFEYVSGAMECTFFEPDAPSLLKKFGIREHICEVLEGGQLAFEERERKYAFKR
jgi:ABC-type sulfate/molybdate transport systems ATPase subunit